MKILVLHQPFPMGNYRLMPYIAQKLTNIGHNVTLTHQLNGASWSDDVLQMINNKKFDVAYYEMLDKQTFKLIEQSNIKKKVLCYTSKGIFKTFEEIIKYKNRYFTSIITNSKKMSKLFSKNNILNKFFEYYPAPIYENEITYDKKYNFSYVYLGGGFHRLERPEYSIEADIIYNNSNVVKYGAGWKNVPNYKGILPAEDIGKLYNSANISIGTIEPSQRKMGMINNRFSEMMKSSATIAAPNYENINYHEAEEFITFINSPEDLSHVSLLSNKNKQRQREFIENKEKIFLNSLHDLL